MRCSAVRSSPSAGVSLTWWNGLYRRGTGRAWLEYSCGWVVVLVLVCFALLGFTLRAVSLSRLEGRSGGAGLRLCPVSALSGGLKGIAVLDSWGLVPIEDGRGGVGG